MKHLDTLLRLSRDDIEHILRNAAALKAAWKTGQRPALLAGRLLTMLFQKPSLRTRVSFEAAMAHLGGSSLFLSFADAGLNGRESLSDVARVLGGYSDCLVIRTFSQSDVDLLVQHSPCPVINGLSDISHPCQALTDFFTMQEVFGALAGRTLVYVGDGNNVARSLASGAALLGVTMKVASPPGYELPAAYLKQVKKKAPAAQLTLTNDPLEAVKDADIVYTDVWASMGQEAETGLRQQVFATYQVNGNLMAATPRHARFMHCLPARRGCEVTDDVLDGPQCIAFEQADNRMHLAKGVLTWLLDVSPP